MRGVALILAAAVAVLASGVAAAGTVQGKIPPMLGVSLAVLAAGCLVAVWSDRLRSHRFVEQVAHVLADMTPGVAASQALGLDGLADAVAIGLGLAVSMFLFDRRFFARVPG